ncbi:nucleoside 2-deoxyribosyltransferase [Candidatus Woesearchaeota archaeon]|nr:nucleoside 2-deoxyribosyltransferase [Candidatus Woesearchaeota archaeon]MBU3942099.1 nucleoside 2-deoxyribosyltransferase [Nanoarchaeota archaeon]
MKIYFAGSIRGGRQDSEIYKQLIEYLKKYGEVLTEHVGDDNLSQGEINFTDKCIHDWDLEWIIGCDVFIAEVTRPSLGVGYEIRTAIEMNKRILCIYRPKELKRVSAMIAGAPGVKIASYSKIEEAKEIIDSFITQTSLR